MAVKTPVAIMTEYPEKPLMYKSVSYSLFGFALLPYVMTLLNLDFAVDYSQLVWMDIVYHVINFGAAAILFAGYLRDGFLNVQIHTRQIIKSAAIGALIMLALTLCMAFVGLLLQNDFLAFGVLPIMEVEMFGTSGTMVLEKPVIGTVIVTLMAPFTISCLFYATVFASVSSERPKLAYVAMAAVLAVPRIVYALTFWSWVDELMLYLVQLPIHMVACRLYQKTDTVWTPIFALMAVNGIMCLLYLL